MAEQDRKTAISTAPPLSDKEQAYRMAKLLRAGERELMRQLNTKKTKRVR